MVGNAVPVRLAYVLAERVKKDLMEHEQLGLGKGT